MMYKKIASDCCFYITCLLDMCTSRGFVEQTIVTLHQNIEDVLLIEIYQEMVYLIINELSWNNFRFSRKYKSYRRRVRELIIGSHFSEKNERPVRARVRLPVLQEECVF